VTHNIKDSTVGLMLLGVIAAGVLAFIIADGFERLREAKAQLAEARASLAKARAQEAAVRWPDWSLSFTNGSTRPAFVTRYSQSRITEQYPINYSSNLAARPLK
jgi:hypothetical protein